MNSFEEFWPFYLRERSRPGTRALHLAGNSLSLLIAVATPALQRPVSASTSSESFSSVL